VSVPVFPEGSLAVTVIKFVPDWRAMELADQLVAPVAVPEPPALLVQVTLDTLVLSEAVPDMVIGEVAVE
jgi:hypothetical protein